VLCAVAECYFALIFCLDYTFLGALLAVVVFSLLKSTLDVILKPAPASNPYVLPYLHCEP